MGEALIPVYSAYLRLKHIITTPIQISGGCVRVTYLPGQANVLSCRSECPVDTRRHKEKTPDLSVGGLCSRYLSSQVGQRIVMPQRVSSGHSQA